MLSRENQAMLRHATKGIRYLGDVLDGLAFLAIFVLAIAAYGALA